MARLLRSERVYERLRDFAENRRRFEIGLLWKRAWLFWGFTAVAFTAYAYCLENTKYFGYGAALIVAAFGFITALIWTLVNRGSKFWQEYWEDQIDLVTDEAITAKASNYKFFDTAERYESEKLKNKGIWGGLRFSPSKLITALSDYVTAAWLVILGIQGAVMLGVAPVTVMGWASPFVLGGTIVFAFWLVFESRRHSG